MDSDTDVHLPSLLDLDAFSLVHVSQFLTCPRDLGRLQCTCKALHRLLQASNVWTKALKLNYGGVQLQHTAPAAAAASSSSERSVVPNKDLCRLLNRSVTEDLYPVRFVAVYTDGGVDTGTLHYWADHAFIPNSWAPFCAKYCDNVNLLAILKTGPDATAELTHRQMMIGCLKWVLPLLQQNPFPSNPETFPVTPAQLIEAAEMLSVWKTQRLESFFCQMAARAAVRDPLGLSMLRGLPAATEARNAAREGRPMDASRAMEERREAARVLGQGIQMRTWYDRAYCLQFFQQLKQQDAAGAGSAAVGGRARGLGPHQVAQVARGGRPTDDAAYDSPYVLDEMAVRSELMSSEVASSMAILHGLAVSREGRLSCPVQSGALLAGLLPPEGLQAALAATSAAAPSTVCVGPYASRAAAPQPEAGAVPMSAYEAAMRAVLEQPNVRALNDKQDAASVFSACADGQLPPWVRHVVMEHAEYIELLPPHLAAELTDADLEKIAGAGGSAQAAGGAGGAAAGGSGGAAGTSRPAAAAGAAAAGVPQLHPVIWFRFTDHAEYSRRRLSSRARALLRHVSAHCRDAADLLDTAMDRLLELLRGEVAEWTRAVAATAGGDRCPPRPESLSAVLHHAISLPDRLISLATALAVLAPELRETAGFVVSETIAEGLMAQSMAVKGDLAHVAQRLAALEQVSQAAQEQRAAVAARMGAVEAAAGAGGLPTGGSGWLDGAVRGVWRALEAEALRDESRRVRVELAAALRAQQAAAAAATEAQARRKIVTERRNEELLRRLPVQPPPETAPAAAAAAATAAVPSAPHGGASASSAAGVEAEPPPPLPAAAATLEPPPSAGWAADRLFDPDLQHDVDSGRAALPEADEDGHRVLHLAARLLFPVAANAVVFKAIRPENLMAMVGWDESEAPNVDVQYVALQGRVVRLPPGLQAVPGA
ncbi:hypothetical protein PLESTF_000687400 [Pleodorina starrii]|nr:hypothetical protein PLESTF_000687400 [Pleodorina starrii]